LTGPWERYLERWVQAGLVESQTAERVRAYEAKQGEAQGLRWPALLAVSLGALLLGAGVLLFVAAHWDTLGPGERFALVLTLVAAFHLAAALIVERHSMLATALHAVGTACLGAGIFLSGQIFHLQEHWPGGVLLWALGAWIAWALLRDWPQAALVAVLMPAWLAGEWWEATRGWIGGDPILAQGVLLLAISYLTAVGSRNDTPTRKALAWIGGVALLPGAAAVLYSDAYGWGELVLPGSYGLVGLTAALVPPLVLAWWLRRDAVWMNFVAALWVIALGATSLRFHSSATLPLWRELGSYAVCALGSIGLIAWGLTEGRKERINLGIAAFALTILAFYFSTVMDKLGRSASLIGLGLILLLGGWWLEKMRRGLMARLEKVA
jgi:hypothetical protein